MTKTAMQMIGEARAQVGTVAPKEAADELDAGAVFVDVREPEEWQHGHIDGSVPAPRGLLEFFADPTSPRHKDQLDPDRRTIVLCASGARASLAALTLKTWATRTSPSSTADSRAGPRPGCRPTSTSTPASDQPPVGAVTILTTRRVHPPAGKQG